MLIGDRARARLARRARALDPRALRRLPLAHGAARGRGGGRHARRCSSTLRPDVLPPAARLVVAAVVGAARRFGLARAFRARAGRTDQAAADARSARANLSRNAAQVPRNHERSGQRGSRPADAVGCLCLWVGVPLGWLWIGSQVQGSLVARHRADGDDGRDHPVDRRSWWSCCSWLNRRHAELQRAPSPAGALLGARGDARLQRRPRRGRLRGSGSSSSPAPARCPLNIELLSALPSGKADGAGAGRPPRSGQTESV